jgi:non-ribosomal peptide synthetase component F
VNTMTPRRTLKINSRSSSQDRTPIPSQLPADRTTTRKPAAAAHRRLLHFDLAYKEANAIGQSLNATLDTLRGVQGISIPDRVRFVLYGLGTIIPAPFSCVHHAFAVQAAKMPDVIAVEHGQSIMTYGNLDRVSNALAHTLRSRGVFPGRRVCLVVQRSISMVVGILAVLKTGASYVPLDGGIVTNETLSFILEDADATLVLCTAPFMPRIPKKMEAICLDSFLSNVTQDPSAPWPEIDDLSHQEDEVYVIYTSGSWLCSLKPFPS